MTTLKLNQLENLSILTSNEQMQIVGAKHGWLKRLFKKYHPETEHPNGNDNSTLKNNPNHDKNDNSYRRGGRG
jgi:hypothetical protein